MFGIVSVVLVITWSFISVRARSPFPDKTTDDFQNQCLKLHNYYRALHNTDPLQVDQKIVEYAKSRCNYISQYDSLSAGHSGLQLGTYGENLFWSASTDGRPVGANNAIKSWYDEIRYYSYSNPTFSSGTGHFTQVIWKSTTSVGCAICGGVGGQWYETYVVCNYQPPGNVMGQFAQNVMPRSTGQNENPTTIPSIDLITSSDSDNDPVDDNQQNTRCRCSNSINDNSAQYFQYISCGNY